jgi:hypothetical protein
MTRVLRALAGLALTASGAVLLAPTALPSSTPLTESSELATAMATFALRVLATSFCGYLTLVLVAVILLEVRVVPTVLRRRIDRWTSGGLAGAVRRTVGASVLAVGVLPMAPAHASEAPPPVLAPIEDPSPPVLRPVDRPSDVADTPRAEPALPAAPPQMAPTDDRPIRPRTESDGPPSHDLPPPPTTPPRIEPPSGAVEHRHPHVLPRTPSRASTTVVVRPGDSVWSVTEDLVALRLGRPPTDKEVIGPWLDLIARNTQVLADPDDPDLLHPGAILHLPPTRAR